MMVAGYEHEGFVIPDEESKDYIWKKVRGNEETKTEILEYMWDVIMDDRKEREKLKEWFFDGVCHIVECDDQGRVKGYFEQ